MIPLKDTIPSRSFPLVTWALIGLNMLVFMFEISLSPQLLDRLFHIFGLVPARLFSGELLSWVPLFTGMFLHGGWFHIISNMWILFIFGDNVEDRMGSGRYLLFYLLSGLIAGLLQTLILPGSNLPIVGASGAIAGVLGAYMLLFPSARVVTLVPGFFLPWFVEISAVFFLGFWFIAQLFSGLFSLTLPGGASMGGVAWWAHIGGFVFGLLGGRRFAPPKPDTYPWPPDEHWPR
ncbi:MAG: rhomboid family intramembrane serine protease [Chloroflexota bacterium]